ncbi:MAG: hypothetical protein ABWY08_08500 [Comamonas sp.]
MKKSLLLITLLAAFCAPAMATVFIAEFVPAPTVGTAPPGTSAPGAAIRPPGLNVQILGGMVTMSNPAGSQTFGAGQFGYVASFTMPPVMLPTNPGLQFMPPPVFNSSSPGAIMAGAPKSNSVDCEVR